MPKETKLNIKPRPGEKPGEMIIKIEQPPPPKPPPQKIRVDVYQKREESLLFKILKKTAGIFILLSILAAPTGLLELLSVFIKIFGPPIVKDLVKVAFLLLVVIYIFHKFSKKKS